MDDTDEMMDAARAAFRAAFQASNEARTAWHRAQMDGRTPAEITEARRRYDAAETAYASAEAALGLRLIRP